MKENKEIFTYTYSARQQEEVRRILQKYTPPQEEDVYKRQHCTGKLTLQTAG